MITGKKTKFIITGTAVVAISLLYFFADARTTGFFPACPFYSLTGLFCPGCGSQRAFSALLHLDILSATRYNVLAVAALPVLVYSAYASFMNAFTTVKVRQRLFYSVIFVRTIAIVVIAFWILRNLPLYPFTLLAPHR